jgi:pimeloyl-ACP methyl ester carboxylesterase
MNAGDYCRSLTPAYLNAGGVRTHYVECGRGPAVILIHGLSASFWNWWQQIPALAQHFRVIAYDLQGFGNSAQARGMYTPESCARQLLGLMDRLGVDRAALVGHSMGVRIALTAAIAAPDRVRSLVLTSPSCYVQTAGRALPLLVLPGLGEMYVSWRYAQSPQMIARRALRGAMHPRVALNDEEIEWNIRSGVGARRRLALAYLKYGRHMQFHRPWPMTGRLREIATPTLVISGDSDHYVPIDHARQLAEAIPNATIEIWKDTGHIPHAEDATRYNRTVTSFLRAQLGGRRRWLERLPREGVAPGATINLPLPGIARYVLRRR